MKTIQLTQGKKVIVSDLNYEYLSQFSWRAIRIRNKWYAVRYTDRHTKIIYMHREIARVQGTNIKADFADGNTLNCQRENLLTSEAMRNIKEIIYNTRSIRAADRWILKPDSEILILPEPALNYSFVPQECHCGQIFYMENIPNHICKPQYLKTA